MEFWGYIQNVPFPLSFEGSSNTLGLWANRPAGLPLNLPTFRHNDDRTTVKVEFDVLFYYVFIRKRGLPTDVHVCILTVGDIKSGSGFRSRPRELPRARALTLDAQYCQDCFVQ